MAQVQAPGELPAFGLHVHQDHRPKREIMCRRCGGWMHWRQLPGTPEPEHYGQHGRWYHTAEGTLACVDPTTCGPYAELATSGG